MKEVKEIPAAPERPVGGHKGTFGTVIVVGGCPTMIGAPAICAAGALRGGAGLVKIAAEAKVLPHALTIEPSATGIALRGDVAASLKRADPDVRAVLAVGPGLGTSAAARALVMKLLGGKRRVVLDADGLNALAASGRARPAGGAELIMTPHPGEFARLASVFKIKASATDEASRPEAAATLARAQRAVVVLKGHRSVVSDGERFYVNTTGNPALATAGSGDILTGLIAALAAQQLNSFDAAVLGVYLHGLAADLWAAENGTSGLVARELAALLPKAFEQHRAGNLWA